MKKNYLIICVCLFMGIGRSNAQLQTIFNGINDAVPTGSLTLSGNVFYGFANTKSNFGSVYSINTDGSGYKDLFDFNGPTGGYPQGSLTLLGNILFGMTTAGGASNNGCIFSINTDGSGYKDFFDFSLTNSNGGSPFGDLTMFGNMLYGMTTG